MHIRFLTLLLAAGSLSAQVDVLTRRMDLSRSGVNANEKLLTQKAVSTNFGKLWTLLDPVRRRQDHGAVLSAAGPYGWQ